MSQFMPMIKPLSDAKLKHSDFRYKHTKATSHTTTRSKVEANRVSRYRVTAIFDGRRSGYSWVMMVMAPLSDSEPEILTVHIDITGYYQFKNPR